MPKSFILLYQEPQNSSLKAIMSFQNLHLNFKKEKVTFYNKMFCNLKNLSD